MTILRSLLITSCSSHWRSRYNKEAGLLNEPVFANWDSCMAILGSNALRPYDKEFMPYSWGSEFLTWKDWKVFLSLLKFGIFQKIRKALKINSIHSGIFFGTIIAEAMQLSTAYVHRCTMASWDGCAISMQDAPRFWMILFAAHTDDNQTNFTNNITVTCWDHRTGVFPWIVFWMLPFLWQCEPCLGSKWEVAVTNAATSQLSRERRVTRAEDAQGIMDKYI